jgi:WD40 repeat protein
MVLHCSVASMSLPVAGVQETQAIIPHRKFGGHPGQVEDILYLRGRQRIMTCCLEGPLRVWDVDSGRQIGEDWGDEAANMNTIALSPNGKKIVGGSMDGAMRLWDIDTAKVIVKWMGHRGSVTSLYWNRDGRRMVSTGYYDDEVRVWDGETGDAILGPLKSGIMTEAVYSPDDTMIATGGNDSHRIACINIWNANTGKPVANMNIGGRFGPTVTSIAWPRHGKTLISGLNDGKIVTWNTTTWQQIAVLTGHTGIVYNIAISSNDLILASVGFGDRTVRLWDLKNGQPIGSPLQHAKDARCLSFSPDGKGLATGCTDGNAYTWDVSAIVREAGREELLPNPRVSLHF